MGLRSNCEATTRRDCLRLGLSVPIGGGLVDALRAAAMGEDGAAPAMIDHRPGIRLIKPHKSGVMGAALGPDGRLLATCGRDRTPKVWDARSGREVHSLSGHEGDVFAVAFSPDGRLLVTAGVAGYEEIQTPSRIRHRPTGYIAKVWDVATWREVAELPSPLPLGLIAIGAGGLSITTLNAENLAQLWDLRDRRPTAELKGTFPEKNRQTSVLRSVAIDAQARRIALSTFDLTDTANRAVLKLWDLDAGRYRDLDFARDFGFGSAGRDCLLSPDGRVLVTTYYNLANPAFPNGAVGGLQRTVLIDFDTGKVLRHTERDLEVYERLIAFSPDGERFLSATEGGVLRLWDTATGRLARSIRGPEGVDVPRTPKRTIHARDVAFLPGGLRVASGGFHGWNDLDKDGRVLVDKETGEVYRTEPLQIWDAEFDWHRERP